MRAVAISAVIFDWGGTLTPWHSVDQDVVWRQVCAPHFPGRGATKEKAFVGLWNPGSRGHDDQTAARFIGSAPHLCSGRCGVSPLNWGARRRRVCGFRVGEKTFSP